MKKYTSPEMEVEYFDQRDVFHFESPAPRPGCSPERECDYDCDDTSCGGGVAMGDYAAPCWDFGGPEIFD